MNGHNSIVTDPFCQTFLKEKTMKLNTPTAILIGLTLIAGALFFRQPIISEAKANTYLAGIEIALNNQLSSIGSALSSIRACQD